MKNMKVYTITGCLECYKLIQQLKVRNILFEEINVMDQPERLGELIKAGECYVHFLVKGDDALSLGDLLAKEQ
ncbi:glutaredoxin domain-containing protein [Bacillus sp. RAR_GA_16]|uniref:glutaredoxin domain-containing protein n=1 Tax=Bacillus sp. RAR_GA_16 TaxID=2876774 RepID=UPI001CC95378|nr:glutaredoxin domain-containing protein [Bacillus sp. RAR_GA_16]MCA0174086.1 hypothetical protein [Bacillus sp. RAR_GA_16]